MTSLATGSSLFALFKTFLIPMFLRTLEYNWVQYFNFARTLCKCLHFHALLAR